MTEIPTITVAPSDGGRLATCEGCGWLHWSAWRTSVGVAAREHKHGKKRGGD